MSGAADPRTRFAEGIAKLKDALRSETFAQLVDAHERECRARLAAAHEAAHADVATWASSRPLPRTWALMGLPSHLWPIVPDYTAHSVAWPYVCEHRGTVPVSDVATVTLVCTRRAHHTGRHAHGTGAIVEAVWEDQ